MGFQFAETMTGTVEWYAQPGVPHPFSFEVTAEAVSTRGHLRDGKAVLHGVVHAPPLARAAEAHGLITIRPIGQRIIRYELEFTGDDGKLYGLVGQKTIDWRTPVRAFTYLPAEIFELARIGSGFRGPLDATQRRIGTCRTTFDLKHDWWSFLRSFRRYDPRPVTAS